MDLSNLFIDGRSGEVLSQYRPWEGTAADVFIQLQLPLHSGRILGLPGQILMSIMGLVVAALSITGIVIRARKARARQRRSSLPMPVGTRRGPDFAAAPSAHLSNRR